MRASYDEKRAAGSIDQRIARIATVQQGVFTRAQAGRCGASTGAIRWRLRAGRWERMYPRVYRLAGTITTWRQEAMAACLYLGNRAALSHRAAASLRMMSGFKLARVEVTVPRNRHRSPSPHVEIHWLQEPIPPEDITTIDGIPVTKPARTLLDLATIETEEVIERCLDEALRRRLVSLPFLERWLAEPARSRHRGAAMLRRLVATRAVVGATESPLETQVLKHLHSAGLPIPMCQYEIRDGERFVARVDFAYPEERVAIEVDGFRYHGDRRAFDDDRARGNEIQALGWRILRITSKHLEENPAAITRYVRRALTRYL